MNLKKNFYRGIAKCLAVLLVINSIAFFPNGKEIQAAENGNIVLCERLTIMSTGYQLNQGGYVNYQGVYKITSIGSSVTNGEIQIQSGNHEIILDNVGIDLSEEATEEVPIHVRKGCSVIFYLKGNSSLTSKGSMPGIYVENGARAEFRRWDEEDFTQEASLTVSAENGAAIGGKASNGTGDITIYSGTFELTSRNGAAIGGGMKATECGDIIINGGHIKASSQNGAGIGGGAEHVYNSNITVNGGDIEAYSDVGAGIGSGANSSFGGNIKIYNGHVKANPGRNIEPGGRGDNENRKKDNSAQRRGGNGGSGFGGIGAGGSHGGAGGLTQSNMVLPESGSDAKKAADLEGNISIFGGYVETASIGGGNAGSGGGGGGSGVNDTEKDLTRGTSQGSGGNGGNGGDNKGSILIAGGEIHCKSIGGGNGGNGGGTGGILYEFGDLSGADGGSAVINYSGAGQTGKNNNKIRQYHAGTGGACGLGGVIKIYGGEIYDVVRIGGTNAEIDRKAGRIYIENSYQTFDNDVMNPHLDSEKVMVEMRIDEGKASKTAQLSKPFELESFTNQDGTLTLWLSSGSYDFEVAIEENVFFTNGFEVRGDMLNYVAVMPCGGVNLSEVSIVVGNEGYNDGVQEPVPFVSSKDRPYIIYGHTEINGITASEPGIYFMKLQNLCAGSEEVPFLSMGNGSEYYIQTEGFGYLSGIKGFGSLIFYENETGYEIRDIDAGISIKDDEGNSRYGTKIQTPWKNQEVIFTYNGSSIKRRTDSEGVLYPLLLQGTNQPVTIKCPAGRLESELSVAARNWSPVSTVNEYNCRDWNLILDPVNGELNILKDTEGYKITSGELAEFIYPGNNIITIEGNGKKADAGIYIEGISAKVICRDINIQTKDSTSPVTVGEGSSVEIILSGDNYFSNTSDAAGIRVPKGSMITISGEGKMEAVGGSRAGGIGGSENDESGNVKIKGQAAVDVKGNMGSADGNSSWDIGPACQEVVVENGTLNAEQISGEIKNGSGEELIKKSYGFTQDFRNRELIYSVDHVNYFTTTVGSDNEVYIYSADSSDIKKIWIIQNGYCYMGTADSSRIFTIDFNNSLLPEFDKNMIQGEIIKNAGEELTLGGKAVPSVLQNELRYTWYYKEKAEDSYNILPAEGFVYYVSNVTPEDEGYYVLEAEESNGQTIRAEFIVKIGKGSEGGNTSGGNTSGGNTSGGNTSGGNTSGGNTSGGNTSGGNTSGGSTSGGNTSGGNTSGGNTSGGSTSGGSTGGGSGSTSGGSTGGGSGSTGGGSTSTGGGSGSSNGGSGNGTAGGTAPSPSNVSASGIVQLDGIVMFDRNNPQLISSWQTSKGIIKSNGNYEFFDRDQWKQQIAVQGKVNLKKENGAEIYFISDYSIKVRNVYTKQEYDISIDEIILDPVPPEISLKGGSLKINDKAGISYKKTFKNKLTVMVNADFSFSGKDGLYYKVIKKGKNVNSVKWKKIKNDKITVKKPMKACIYIKGVDKLGKETVVRTQGFRIV